VRLKVGDNDWSLSNSRVWPFSTWSLLENESMFTAGRHSDVTTTRHRFTYPRTPATRSSIELPIRDAKIAPRSGYCWHPIISTMMLILSNHCMQFSLPSVAGLLRVEHCHVDCASCGIQNPMLKSSVFFNPNMDASVCRSICRLTCCHVDGGC
jgi:hypothetical protein